MTIKQENIDAVGGDWGGQGVVEGPPIGPYKTFVFLGQKGLLLDVVLPDGKSGVYTIPDATGKDLLSFP